MDKKGWMILKILINHYHPKTPNMLIKYLPKEDAEVFLKQDLLVSDLRPIFEQPQKMIQKLHYSWLEPLILQLPQELRPVAISCLDEDQANGLQKLLSFKSKKQASPPIKTFLLHQIYTYLTEKEQEHLPLEYLPVTDLSPLGTWTKKQLTILIDFLGLHDLAVEIKQIVNKNYLKNLTSCLSSQQLYYLKVCLHQKDKLITPKLGLDPTKRDCTKLLQILHKRGLIRLGKALSGQHPDLVWHISHILDTGRGLFIMQQAKGDVLPQVVQALKNQVTNLINFLKKEPKA